MSRVMINIIIAHSKHAHPVEWGKCSSGYESDVLVKYNEAAETLSGVPSVNSQPDVASASTDSMRTMHQSSSENQAERYLLIAQC